MPICLISIFSKVTFSPLQFFSKRWVGNVNLLFSRGKKHNVSQLDSLSRILVEQEVDILCITGDLSTTGRHVEFCMACTWLETLRSQGIKTIVLPGNHDHYTNEGYQKNLFYKYFSNKDFPFLFPHLGNSLQKEKIEAVELNEDWIAICLDTAIPTSWFSSLQAFFLQKWRKNLYLKYCQKSLTINES